MKSFLFLGVFLISVFSWAGPRVNNGGGVWTCREFDSYESVRWIRTHDLLPFYTVSTSSTGMTLREFGPMKAWRIYRQILREIATDFPDLQILLAANPVNLRRKILVRDGRIDVINDAQIYSRPAKSSCPNGALQYEQVANFIADEALLLDSSLWENPKLTETHKAALLVHEHLYYVMRKVFLDQTSARVQFLVAVLMSEQNAAVKKNLITTILHEDYILSRRFNGVALFNVRLQCGARLLDDKTSDILEEKILRISQDRKSSEQRMGNYVFKVAVNDMDGLPQEMSIYNEKTGALVENSTNSLRAAFLQERAFSFKLNDKKAGISAEMSCWSK